MRKRIYEEDTAEGFQHDLELTNAFDPEGINIRKEEYSEVVGDEGNIFEAFDEHDDAIMEGESVFDKESFMDSWLDNVSPRDVLEAARSHRIADAAPRKKMSIIQACEKLLQLLPGGDDKTLKELIRTGGSVAIEELTECATVLIDNGIYEAYELTKPDLLDLYNSLTSEPSV